MSMKSALLMSMAAIALMSGESNQNRSQWSQDRDEGQPVRYDGELKDYKNKKCKSCKSCHQGYGKCSYPNNNACSDYKKRKRK